MRFIAVLPLALLGSASAAHPVGSVIDLLKELQAKAEAEGEAELATYTKFKQWCTDSSATLGDAVTEETQNIDTLGDTVASKTREKDATGENIAFLETEITKYEAETVQSQKDRDEANKLYEESAKDLEDTVKAMDEAIAALSATRGAFLQFQKPQTSRQEQALTQLLQRPLVLAELSDAQRNAFAIAVAGEQPKVTELLRLENRRVENGNDHSSKTGNVLELLEKLKTTFEAKLTQATKDETSAVAAFDLASSARKDTVEASKEAKNGKTALLAEVSADLNTATSSLAEEKDELTADSATFADTKRTCNMKQSEWNERTDLRNHEMEALKAAVEILAKVSGVRTEAPTTAALPTAPTAATEALLLQADNPKKMKVVNLLRKEATETHSKELARFADQLASRLDGPFDQVDGMIQKMIFRLKAEQTDEDSHKLWCDNEMSKSNTSQEDKSDTIKGLDAKIKDAKANSDEMALEIKDLGEKVAKLTEYMGEATEVRQEGKKENAAAMKDAKDAQAAIAKAEAVLASFYQESLLQVSQPEAVALPTEPAMWSSGYTGVADPEKAGEGVIAVLRATAADFAKMEAESRAQEITDQMQFDTDMKESAIDKAKNAKEAEMKSDEKKRTLDKVNSLMLKRKNAAKELEAVDQYIKDLQPACVEGDSSYEDRKAARDSEVKALKEAQASLKAAFEEKSFLQCDRRRTR
jgi:hypothetical protein